MLIDTEREREREREIAYRIGACFANDAMEKPETDIMDITREIMKNLGGVAKVP